MSGALRPFHLALPVDDLEQTRAFYAQTLGCSEGRSSDRWVDVDFFGHQLTLHLTPAQGGGEATNPVDGRQVPTRHFGVILPIPDWEALATRVTAAKVNFLIEPSIRFAGSTGEQRTMFFRDPSGNALEFKAFATDAQIFAND